MQYLNALLAIFVFACIVVPNVVWASDLASPPREAVVLIERFCLDCHNSGDRQAGIDLETMIERPLLDNVQEWEMVVRKVGARQMPPAGSERPGEGEFESLNRHLIESLDSHGRAHPAPGHVDTLRRLNRTEYQNAIRDLLAIPLDGRDLLPADESSHGFDNITVGELSPLLLNRYISAAQKISRMAVGTPGSPAGDTYRPPADLTQEDHVPGLPLGTRGGLIIPYNFPRDGEYEIQIHLTRDRNEKIEGLSGTHELLILFDRQQRASFQIKPPAARNNHNDVDANLRTRLKISAGPKNVGVTFVKKPYALLETKRQPYVSRYNYHRHPRQSPAIFQVSITGPFGTTGVKETPSRGKIFIDRPSTSSPAEVEQSAKVVLRRLMRFAYRRPIGDDDLKRPMEFFRTGFADGGFDAGIELAMSSILVSPHFLFRHEKQPADVSSGEAFHLSDLELATRLSFFLWSSIPDDELLGVAERGELSDPTVLETQTRRMLSDPRSQSLVDNFASQWLYLRNLDSIVPNHRLFPDFDHNLRQSFRRETELLFESILREDRSVLTFLQSDYTFLNERLAKHYRIPNVHGNRFRKVSLAPEHHRGGLLRHGSILTVTSYATRTSPVIRGNWVLENIIGTPAPPPPDDVPALEDNRIDQNLPMRERLSAHRSNPACASCHNLMDPVGFALENYDAIGRWRSHEDGVPLDVSGGLPDGQTFVGIDGLERGLLRRPELFVTTLAEKLMTFAVGRGVEPTDGAAIRKIVADSEVDEYRMSSIIVGIVRSVPFRMRTAQ